MMESAQGSTAASAPITEANPALESVSAVPASVSEQQQSQQTMQTQQSMPAAPSASSGSIADFTDVVTAYSSEINKEIEGLRQRAQAASQEVPAIVQTIQSQIEPTARQLAAAVSQTEGGVTTPARPVVQAFLWAGILLLAATFVAPIGSILEPLIGVFLGKSGAALLAYFGIPAIAFYSLSADEVTARYQLAGFAAAEALLAGFVLSHSYLASVPLTAVTAIAVAAAYPVVLPQLSSSRAQLVGAVLGAAFAAQIVVGLALGLSGAYISLSILYTASAGVVLQTVLTNVQSAEVNVNMYQLAAFSLVMLSHGLIHLVFGSSQPVPRQ